MAAPAQILHLISRLDAYGSSRMLRHLACHQARQGANVAVAALTADPRSMYELRDAGVEADAFGSRGPWDVVAPARLVRIANRSNAEIIHAWDARTLALVTLVARRRAMSSCVATFSQVDATRTWTRRVIRQSRHRVAAWAVSDKPTKAWLAESGVDAGGIISIPPGAILPSAATATRGEALAHLSLPVDAPLIAVVSPLVRSKRLDEVIWHFELVRVLHPPAKLLVIGDGPDRPRLQRYASQVSDLDAVRFLGFRTDHAALLRHVDVYWQLNASSATPWALLEALAAGTPVVAADVPAHRAVVASEQYGRLVAHNDRAAITRATDELLVDSSWAQGMGRAASTRILAERPLKAALQEYEQLYRRARATAEVAANPVI